MNWESIKSNCVRSSCQKLKNSDISLVTLACLKTGEIPIGKGTIRQKLTKELEDEIVKIITDWDIRNYGHLQNLFPEHFPKNINGLELTDKGWILV